MCLQLLEVWSDDITGQGTLQLLIPHSVYPDSSAVNLVSLSSLMILYDYTLIKYTPGHVFIT